MRLTLLILLAASGPTVQAAAEADPAALVNELGSDLAAVRLEAAGASKSEAAQPCRRPRGQGGGGPRRQRADYTVNRPDRTATADAGDQGSARCSGDALARTRESIRADRL